MARKNQGLPLHGWIAIDKPYGMSSATVVAQALRLLGAQKAGHGGTLDPLATGVLPIAFGEATKTVSFVMDGQKDYHFTIKWGEEKTTDDCEGETICISEIRPSVEMIHSLIPQFTGFISQVPPIFSAIKVDGQRAYAKARRQESVTLSERQVYVESLTLLSSTLDLASFSISCGKGTYIRSIARDMGRLLGCYGHISQLRRVRCGPFTEENTICLDKLREIGHSATSANFMLPVELALDDILAIDLTDDEACRLQNGQVLSIDRLTVCRPSKDIVQPKVLKAMSHGRLVALVRIEGSNLHSIRGFNLV